VPLVVLVVVLPDVLPAVVAAEVLPAVVVLPVLVLPVLEQALSAPAATNPARLEIRMGVPLVVRAALQPSDSGENRRRLLNSGTDWKTGHGLGKKGGGARRAIAWRGFTCRGR
jgi:hypothetical protein